MAESDEVTTVTGALDGPTGLRPDERERFVAAVMASRAREHEPTETAQRKAINYADTVIGERYAWPGGYELALVLSDGEALCAKCAGENYREIVQASINADSTGGWLPVGMTHTGEVDDELACAHCYRDLLTD